MRDAVYGARDEQGRADPLAELLSIAETARILGVHRKTVGKLIRRHGIPVVQVGAKTKLRPADLAAFIDTQTVRERGR